MNTPGPPALSANQKTTPIVPGPRARPMTPPPATSPPAKTGSPQTDSPRSLHAAAKDGIVATLKQLLDANVDPTLSGAGGETALHWAAAYGHREAAQLLLTRGANVNARGGRNDAAAVGGGLRADARSPVACQPRRLRKRR